MVSGDAAMEVDKGVEEVVANETSTFEIPWRSTRVPVTHPKPFVVSDSDSEAEIASGAETKGKAAVRLTMKPLLNSKFLGFDSAVHQYWKTPVRWDACCVSRSEYNTTQEKLVKSFCNNVRDKSMCQGLQINDRDSWRVRVGFVGIKEICTRSKNASATRVER